MIGLPPTAFSRPHRRAFMERFQSFIRAFLIALAAVACVEVVRRLAVAPLLGLEAPLMAFTVAVVAAAWIGGFLPGALATILGAAAGVYVFLAANDFEGLPQRFQVRFVTFIVTGLLVSWAFHSIRSARRPMEARQRELEEKTRQLEHEVHERRKAEAAERERREELAAEIHRRTAAEQAVREREERMRMAIESADIGTWDFNPLTGERQWSARAKEMFGISPDAEVTNVSYLDRIHPDDQDRVRQAVERALDPTADGRYEVECRLVRPDGATGWFVVKGQAFFEGEGPQRRPNRFIGTVMETTERKKAEQALRQAEERFRQLATHAPVGIFHTDALGRCLFVNDEWCATVGATATEALGDGWAKFLHVDDRKRVVREWRHAAQHRITQVTEFRFDNPSRGVRWVIASATPLLDEAQNVTGYVGTIVDITDRKQVEDVIRAEEARLRSILDNTPAVISLKDLHGRYVLVNRGWEELFGVSNDQIVGRTNFDLLKLTTSCHMSQRIADQFADLEQKVIQTGAPIEFEDPEPDGVDQKIFGTVKFPITGAGCSITGVGGISLDVTERRKALDSLKSEQEMMRRTIEMQDHERQVIAYEIHDGLIQYAAGALMQLESVRYLTDSKQIAETVDSAAEAVRRAVEEGRRIMNGIRTPVLDDLGVVAALEQLIQEEDRAHVHVEFVSHQQLERMDPRVEEAIYRITQEALTNVRKHSESKQVRVELDRLNDRVHLEIRDWGRGFTPRNGATVTYGLKGMAERARIVGGLCKIESRPGDGTRVVADLPYQVRAAEEE